MPRLTMLTALLAGLAANASLAADFSDPDWPCVQRKVLHLSVGQMWAGPPIGDQDLVDWRKNEAVAGLAPALAVRRTALEEAERLIADFAASSSDPERELPLLFAGAFRLIDRERSEIIAGIGRYSQSQIALAKKIETNQNRLSDLTALEQPDFDQQDEIEELEDRLHWEMRIYKDRAQSLTYVCETPVILEQRAFSLARTIMAQLE